MNCSLLRSSGPIIRLQGTYSIDRLARPALRCHLHSHSMRRPRSTTAAAGDEASGTSPAVVKNPGASLAMPLIMSSIIGTLLYQRLVPTTDIAVAAGLAAYFFLVNTFRFNSNKQFAGRAVAPLVPLPWLPSYALGAAVLSILAPGAVMLVQRDEQAVASMLAPHVFLVCAQVVCEFFTATRNAAILVRMLTPISFNTYRLLSLVAWLKQAGTFGVWHQALAAGNLAFWSFNLFGFLLLVMVPMYLDREKCAV